MSLLYSTDRPEFLERIAKLAGGTTFREPAGGRGTKMDQLPDVHAIATALAFARNPHDPDDIGPDVAYCWATQSDAYRERVTRRLSIALRCHATRSHGQHRLAAAQLAWDAMIHNRKAGSRPPADVRPMDWDRLLLAAVATLQSLAWEALVEAERAYRREA